MHDDHAHEPLVSTTATKTIESAAGRPLRHATWWRRHAKPATARLVAEGLTLEFEAGVGAMAGVMVPVAVPRDGLEVRVAAGDETAECECVICFDSSRVGVRCDGSTPHFVCAGCLSDYVKSEASQPPGHVASRGGCIFCRKTVLNNPLLSRLAWLLTVRC